MNCHQYRPRPLSRREMLAQAASGFGAVALTALLHDPAYGLAPAGDAPRGLHHEPRAKNVIFLYMDGGPSYVDTFDPKPRLEK